MNTDENTDCERKDGKPKDTDVRYSLTDSDLSGVGDNTGSQAVDDHLDGYIKETSREGIQESQEAHTGISNR